MTKWPSQQGGQVRKKFLELRRMNDRTRKRTVLQTEWQRDVLTDFKVGKLLRERKICQKCHFSSTFFCRTKPTTTTLQSSLSSSLFDAYQQLAGNNWW